VKTVKQVAELSGVSVRALHHYDHIGLLSPPTGGNGYRYYGERELLRLQQILFYRELGVALVDIARILDDPGYDVRAALRDLRSRVASDIARRQALARTIDETLACIDAGRAVDGEHLYVGISAEKQAQWEAELIARYGESARATVDESQRRMQSWSAGELADFKAEIDAIHQAFIELIDAGGSPVSVAAQRLAARHHGWVSRSWTPNGPRYAALGQMYVEHADFRAMYDALHPRLAEFLAAAMAGYARQLPETQP
jgi:DNA-binding transcriptional MerR regulator